VKFDNIAIHIESKHTCGHMHKTIFHVKDPKLEGHVSTQYSLFDIIGEDEDFTLPNEPETENKLELTGSLGCVELTTCVCHLSRRARLRQWIARLFSRYRCKESNAD
jgi:hypothetical protein